MCVCMCVCVCCVCVVYVLSVVCADCVSARVCQGRTKEREREREREREGWETRAKGLNQDSMKALGEGPNERTQ
jgi:hypothetical protein